MHYYTFSLYIMKNKCLIKSKGINSLTQLQTPSNYNTNLPDKM